MSVSIAGFEVTTAVVLLGVITGLTYGLLAAGLVLIYRTNRVINFAHSQVGAFAAALFGLATVTYGVPYYVALVLAIVAAAGVGACAEIAVVRRLRNVPRLMTVVATLGIGELLIILGSVVNQEASAGSLFPQPPGLPTFTVGSLHVTQAYSGMILFTPVVIVALTVFLRRSRFGLAIRAAAANPDGARLTGVFTGRMSSLAWAIAGGLSALTAILFIPTSGFVADDVFGPSLLLRALVPAVLARMVSMPRALAGGVAVGVIEQCLLWNSPRGGLVEAVLFGIILLALLVQRRLSHRQDGESNWASVSAGDIPRAWKRLWFVRHFDKIFGAVLLVLAVSMAFFVSSSGADVLTRILVFAIVGLGLGIVTGLSGQLSLGQFALAGVGGAVAHATAVATGSFVLGLLAAGLATAAASLVIGLPALRIRGLLLAVVTLSFALMAPAWLLQQEWLIGTEISPSTAAIGGMRFASAGAYYLLTLVVFVLLVLATRNVRKGGVGRRFVAVRDNEDAARAFGISAWQVKLQAFVVAGFITGIGGALFVHSLPRVTSADFPVIASIDTAIMVLVGSVGVLLGPLIGSVFVMGGPDVIPLDSAGLATTRLGLLIVILYLPAGLGNALVSLRNRMFARMARRADGEPAEDEPADSERSRLEIMGRPPAAAIANDRPILELSGLTKDFGGTRAVDGVDLQVWEGETVGLIGPNGAGKTTCFELISGFSKPTAGTIHFLGDDITRKAPDSRVAAGLVRSFQDAMLFPTMIVSDVVKLALERGGPTPVVRSSLGLPAGERAKESRMRELVGMLGLHRYRDARVRELSTGTRRILELTCLIALEPRLLLLDEPTAGVAQRETESMRGLIEQIKRDLGTTLVIIEHDVPMVMSLSDRVLAMDRGAVIASGTPTEVRADPEVIRAYLGGDDRAIERSDTVLLGE